MNKNLYIPIDTTLNNLVECEELIKRGDTLVLTIKVFNNGVLANLAGQSVDLILQKSDGTKIEKTIDVSNISNGVVTIQPIQQSTLASGIVQGELQIYSNNTLTSTNTFTYEVSTSLADNVLEISQNDIQVLADLKTLIATSEVTIAEYENSVLAIGNSVSAIDALANIKLYIDNNLPALESANAQAVVNIANETNANNLASQNIANLTTQNNAATQNISDLTAKNNTASQNKIDLDAKNLTASQNISALDTKNGTASTNISALDSKNGIASTNLTNLDSENDRAEINIEALENFGDATQLTLDMTAVKNELSVARNGKTSLDERLDESDTDLSNVKNEVVNARGVELNLKARLDKVDTSLSEKANQNEIINGNFDFWQRGTSLTNPANITYLADRFEIIKVISGTAPTNIIHSRQVLTPGDIDKASYFYRVNSDSNSALSAGDYYGLWHHIENGTKKLCGNGKKVTLSFWARSSISNKKLGVHLLQNYGTGGSPSTAEVLTGKYFNLTSSWTKYSFTFSTNTLSGKVFGNNNDDLLRVSFALAYGATNAVNVGDTVTENLANGTIDIAQIKVESGDKATPFVPRPIGEELLLCQRYYQIIRCCGIAVSPSLLPFFTNYSVPMRVTPTTKMYNAMSLNALDRFGVGSLDITGYGMAFQNNMHVGYLTHSSDIFVTGSTYEGDAYMDAEIY